MDVHEILRRYAPLNDKNGIHKSYIKHHTLKIMEKTNIWSKILKIVITVLTAVATTFGLQACG